MLKFRHSTHDHFSQPDTHLSPSEELVLALRGFACRFSILLYAYRQQDLVASVIKERGPGMSDDEAAMYWFLEHSLTQHIVVNIRALIDTTSRTLGAKAIHTRLCQPEARTALSVYLDKTPDPRRTVGTGERDQYLDYIARYTKILCTQPQKGQVQHPLVGKVALLKRWANKTQAHMTLDHYAVPGADLHDVFLAIAIVACAIDAVMGDAGCSTDYLRCEEMAVRAAEAMFEHAAEPHTDYIRFIRGHLPGWVHSGEEYPDYHFG